MINKLKRIYYKIAKVFMNDEKYAMTLAIDYAKMQGVKVGERCRFFSTQFSTEQYLISIGNHVTIASGVYFITHDGGVWVIRDLGENYKNCNLVGKIEIEDNVFIGMNALIMPGVRIGKNSIVAAGSVVTKSFPEGSVIAGVPAKRIKSIDEYIIKNKDLLIDTKQLTESEKQEYILNNIYKLNLKTTKISER